MGTKDQSRASFPRKRESRYFEQFWTPAFAGATLMMKSFEIT
jgi:hypothetical protein